MAEEADAAAVALVVVARVDATLWVDRVGVVYRLSHTTAVAALSTVLVIKGVWHIQ